MDKLLFCSTCNKETAFCTCPDAEHKKKLIILLGTIFCPEVIIKAAEKILEEEDQIVVTE